MNNFNHAVKYKGPYLEQKKILLKQNNARDDTCVVAMAKCHKLGYELLPNPQYSSDLAPSHYFLLATKMAWRKKIFSYDKVIVETNAYFKGQSNRIV